MFTITEITPTLESRPIINEAAMLIFKHIGQREEGYSKFDLVAQSSYAVDVDVSRLFVAQNEKAKIIGAATLRLPLTNRDHLLEYLAVLPKYRGHGVGAQLLEIAEEAVIATGHTKLTIEPYDSVKEFYQKRGYNYAKSRHSNLMVKDLNL